MPAPANVDSAVNAGVNGVAPVTGTWYCAEPLARFTLSLATLISVPALTLSTPAVYANPAPATLDGSDSEMSAPNAPPPLKPVPAVTVRASGT